MGCDFWHCAHGRSTRVMSMQYVSAELYGRLSKVCMFLQLRVCVIDSHYIWLLLLYPFARCYASIVHWPVHLHINFVYGLFMRKIQSIPMFQGEGCSGVRRMMRCNHHAKRLPWNLGSFQLVWFATPTIMWLALYFSVWPGFYIGVIFYSSEGHSARSGWTLQ